MILSSALPEAIGHAPPRRWPAKGLRKSGADRIRLTALPKSFLYL
jgi:hypothetical protein